MGQVKIRAVPQDEEYLFAKKVCLITKSLIGIPNKQTVKLVVTNKALYIKIANVLIDLSGTERMRIDEIRKATIREYRAFKKYKQVSFEDPFSLFCFELSVEDCENIREIVSSINPELQFEEIKK